MTIFRKVLVVIGAWIALAGVSDAVAEEVLDTRPARSEERLVIDLAGPDAVMRLSERRDQLRAPFTIAPGARSDAVELVLSARPESVRSGGRIEVAINGGRPVVLSPRAESFEARFALYSADLRQGRNVLSLRFTADGADGWIIGGAETRLRIEAAPPAGFASLSDVEAALGADYAAPRRAHVDGGGGEADVSLEALTAQGLAIRMGETPVFTSSSNTAEIIVRAAIAPGSPTAVRLVDPRTIELTGSDSAGALAAARLFSDRSLEAAGDVFSAAAALQSTRLRRESGEVAPPPAGDLSALAATAAPFSADQGARAAIIVAGETQDDRTAALAVLSRAALASGEAWSFAWFGADASAAPRSHHVLAIGPLRLIEDGVLSGAPAEVREATETARREQSRERRFMGSSAYADDMLESAGPVTGLAAIYEQTPGRYAAVITSPARGGFARSAVRLARSDLWSGLAGSTALWTATTVTPVESAGGGFSFTAGLNMDIAALGRWLALLAFALAGLLIASSGAINRSSSPAE